MPPARARPFRRVASSRYLPEPTGRRLARPLAPYSGRGLGDVVVPARIGGDAHRSGKLGLGCRNSIITENIIGSRNGGNDSLTPREGRQTEKEAGKGRRKSMMCWSQAGYVITSL